MTVWTYPRCTIRDVHDGDTVKVDIDHGLSIWSHAVAVRLAGVACRELSDPGGPEAAAYLSGVCPPGSPVRVESHTWDKYGRVLGIVYLLDGRTVQELLIANGFAVAWDGRGRQPKPPWPVVTGQPT